MTESEKVAVRRQEEARRLYERSQLQRDLRCLSIATINQELAEVVSHGTRVLMGVEQQDSSRYSANREAAIYGNVRTT